MYPAPCIAITITTRRQIVAGLSEWFGPIAVIGNERQHNQRAGGEQQPVVQLALRQRFAHEQVQPLTLGEKDRRADTEPGRQAGVALGQCPEEKIDEQSDLRREARILLIRGHIRRDRGESDDPKRHRGNRHAPDAIAQPAEERDQRESPDPRRSPLRSPTLAALALHPEQQANAQRDKQTDRRIAHRSHSWRATDLVICGGAARWAADIRRLLRAPRRPFVNYWPLPHAPLARLGRWGDRGRSSR